MRTYSPNIAAMRKKVKKVHNKNRLVGVLYLIGTLLLIVLAFFPCLKIKFADGGESLSLLSFFKALLLVFQGNVSALFVFLLYLIMTFILLVFFFRIFSQFRRVMRKNDRNVNACNRNLSAMEKMGDMFSFVFTTVVIMNFLMYILTPTTGDMMVQRNEPIFELFGYIFLVLGLVIHFVAGAIGGTSSLFIVGVSVEERKRADSIVLYVVRNAIQVVATLAIVYFVTPVLTIHNYIASFDFSAFSTNSSIMLGFLLQIVAVVFIIFLIKNAMSTIEFNLMGMDVSGFHRTAIFSLLTGLVCVGAFLVDKNWSVNPPAMIYNYLIAGIAGIVCFILSLAIRPRMPKEEDTEEIREWKDVNAAKPERPGQEKAPQVQQPQQPVAQMPALPASIDLNLVIPKSRCPEDCSIANIGMSATKYEVVCPTCGKKLSVKQASYHRCPSCGKVFQLNIGKIGKVGAFHEEEPINMNKKTKKVKKTKKTTKNPVLTEELSLDSL